MTKANSPAPILFPHGDIGEVRGRALLEHISSFTLCLPWHTDPPKWATQLGINILYPPEELRPPPFFNAVLAQFKQRLEQDRGADYLAYAASLTTDEEPSATDLAAMIRQGKSIKPAKDEALRLNLIIRLFHDTEKEKQHAEDLLADIRFSPSPLREALEEDTGGILQDLAPSISQIPPTGSRARQIIEAWCGLFSGCLTPEDSLLTLEPWVVEAVFFIFGEEITLGKGKQETLLFTVPLPARKHDDLVLDRISGRKLILLR
jgi:hypothetical protein